VGLRSNRSSKPILMVVDNDPEALSVLEQTLQRRYAADYQILTAASPAAGLAALERIDARGEEVAVVIAPQSLPHLPGAAFLARAHRLHPAAKRVLLVSMGGQAAAAVLQAMTLGQIDDYTVRPWGHPEERLYPLIGELLSAWVKATGRTRLAAIRVVGRRRSPRSHELRDLLERNGVAYGFHFDDSAEGRRLLEEAHQDGTRLPVVLMWDGRVLVDPSVAEIVGAAGGDTRPTAEVYDVAIVGAGPAGLTAATYGASEGLRTLLLEREAVGGQAGTSSLIRNYLGFPRGVSGRELASRASEQAWLFGANFVFNVAAGLRTRGPNRVVTLADGSQATSRAVVVATGVSYRRLDVPGLERLSGAGVFYGAAVAEAAAMAGQEVFVVGAGNSAGQAALHLAKHAAHVTIVARGESLAASMSDYLVKEIGHTANLTVSPHTRVAAVHGAGQLQGITLQDISGGPPATVPAAALFILIGAEPHTDWLADTLARDDRGFILTGRDLVQDRGTARQWPLDRPPFPLESSIPGVFAAGDVRHRSVKRVASAVGDGSIAIQLIHEYLNPR
jgi:thioredoxin reductase (NADPH)